MRFHIKPKRRKLSAEEVAANAAARAAREKAGMHCQCCGRLYLANTGTMAHHGYQRPGFGWQTASCMGAKALPFEADRSKLALMIAALKRLRVDMIKMRAAVASGKQPIKRSYRESIGSKAPRVEFEITKETFAEQAPLLRKAGNYSYAWDDLLKSELFSRDHNIKNLSDEIASQEARYDGWKQTHRWNAEQKEWEQI